MKRILLAEDDNDMRQFLTRALKTAGYEVVSFDNGKSAYERLREEPFSLLLSDIVMPEMDGIELARRATELDPDLKVMFITGFAAVALNPDSDAPKDASVTWPSEVNTVSRPAAALSALSARLERPSPISVPISPMPEAIEVMTGPAFAARSSRPSPRPSRAVPTP